jgi:hypothetical protein
VHKNGQLFFNPFHAYDVAAGVAHELRGILGDFGPGEICQADNGKEFGKQVALYLYSRVSAYVVHSEQVEKVVNDFSMHLVHGSSYHPESHAQGAVERANKLFKVAQ